MFYKKYKIHLANVECFYRWEMNCKKNRKEHLFYNAIHGIIESVARNKCIQLNIDVKSI